MKSPIFAALLLSMSLFSACALAGDNGDSNEHSIAFSWNIEATYPQTGEEKADQAIRAWVKRIMTSAFGDISEHIAIDPDSPEENSWDMSVGYAMSQPSDKIVSLLCIVYTYPGRAAHPSGHMETLNIIKQDGTPLALSDLFEKPDQALVIFAEHSKELVTDWFGKNNPDAAKSLTTDAWFDAGFEAVPENYSVLQLEPEGIRIHFQQYQILPYAFGMSEAFFPLDMLAPAGPKAGIWGEAKK